MYYMLLFGYTLGSLNFTRIWIISQTCIYNNLSYSILYSHTLQVLELFFEYMKKDSQLLAFGDIFPESVWVDRRIRRGKQLM